MVLFQKAVQCELTFVSVFWFFSSKLGNEIPARCPPTAPMFKDIAQLNGAEFRRHINVKYHNLVGERQSAPAAFGPICEWSTRKRSYALEKHAERPKFTTTKLDDENWLQRLSWASTKLKWIECFQFSEGTVTYLIKFCFQKGISNICLVLVRFVIVQLDSDSSLLLAKNSWTVLPNSFPFVISPGHMWSYSSASDILAEGVAVYNN